jgi:anti-sigma regulatory factor (Ser/Thr protein kinase)
MTGPPNVTLRLAGRADNVTLVREVLGGLAEAVDFGHALDDVKAAVSEAANNVVVHAYGGDEGPLEVDLRLAAFELEVAVRDRGMGGWQREKPDDEAPRHGLGLTVIDALALRTDVRIRAGEGTQVTMWFEIADPGGRFEAPPDPAPRPFTVPDGDVAVAISPAPLGTAILGRLVGALAARAGFSIDRLSDAQLVTDSLAAHVGAALDGPYVNAAIAVLEGRAVALELDGLRDGGAAALLAGSAIASLGPVIERLADEIEVRAGARGETLRLVLRDPWRSF